MTVIIILLSVIVGVGAILYIHHRLTFRPAEQDIDSIRLSEEQEQCCGLHLNCEKGLPLPTEIIYYDDEELDTFSGRDPESYDDGETEQFRDVLLTLLPSDIAGWAQSLKQRKIRLPEVVREELMLLITEARAATHSVPSNSI